MPQNFEEKYPNNGMNRDDESRYLEQSDSRFILNTRAGSSDDDNIGAIENIKGTTEVQFNLPAGRNKCIGSEGDQTTNSNFFFVWNSNNNHTIYRYFPDNRTVRILVQDELLKFSEHDLINDISVVQDLLFWRDNDNPPRKINLEKADNDNKSTRQKWNWYLGDEYMKGQTSLDLYFTQRTDRYGGIGVNVPFTLTYTLLDPTTTPKTDIAKDLANQINNVASMATPIIKATSCGEYVEIESITPDYITIGAMQNNALTAQVVPQNHYYNYVERTIDVIKHPTHCEVIAAIQTDVLRNRNYISKKVFQFASRIIYDDDEKSTVNPYSINIYNKFSCPQFSRNNLNNYIRIDLSVIPEISNLLDLQTIKRLELYFKEGELGEWKQMTVLEQFQFIDTADQHFDFYNDENYTVVDQKDFVRPYDLVPQLTKNMEITKNRQFFANNLEGYDNTCVDTELVVTYDDVESRISPPTYTVSGRIDIRAAFNGSPKQGIGGKGYIQDHQPIWRDYLPGTDAGSPEDNPIVFGGISVLPGQDPTLQDISGKTGQILPLGGFTVYLAGTDYYGISKQKPGTYSGGSAGQDENGVFQGSGDGYVDSVRDYIKEEDDFGELYSTFEIHGVPDGWYTLRVAGHGTTQGELDSGERSYQRTSTNVFQMQNFTGGFTQPEEAFGTHELLVHINGGSISGIQVDIMDLSHSVTLFGDQDKGSSHIMTGYLAASDINFPSVDYDIASQEARLSNSIVKFNLGCDSVKILTSTLGFVAAQDANSWAEDYWLDYGDTQIDSDFIVRRKINRTITDHNGYFFFASMQVTGYQPLLGNLSIEEVGALRSPGTPYGFANYSNGNGSGVLSDVKTGQFTELIVRCSGDLNFNRVKVIGQVLDQEGLGIPDAPVVSNRAAVAYADGNGDFEFWHFGILRGVYPNDGIVMDNYNTVLFPTNAGGACSAIYEDSQFYEFGFNYPTEFNTFPNVPNKITNNLPITIQIPSPLFLGDSTSMKTLNAFKRGGDWKLGIVYYDRGLRSGAVNTEENLKLHIPFYSEKDIDDTIKNGVPVIDWEVKHRPPSWATHWQWVRTKNTTVGSYMQWAIGEVQYTNDDGTVSTFQAGTRIRLDVDNLNIYANKNPGTDLQFSIDPETTRVRFIKNQDGVRYVDYFDFPVLSWSPPYITIEKTFDLGNIQNGVLVEMYNEILNIDTQVYYEFGECFEVKSSTNNIKYHGGLDQDQNPLQPSSIPAKGRFRTGDAYYRLRGIPRGEGNSISYIDDDAVSDFYKSEVESIGRPNAEDPDAGQIWKPNQIRHSLKYIPDTKINGFSTFYALNFTNLPIEFGDIYKLQLVSNVLMSIHEFRWVSNYIEEAIVRKQGGGDDLVASTDVFGSFRAHKGLITGTINQESVVEYKGNVYAFDKNKGLVTRWGADGLTVISDYKMSDYFSDKAKEILTNEKKTSIPNKILGVYDSKYNEYIISFGDIAKRALETDPGDSGLPTYRVGLDVNNSSTIEVASNETLYSAKGMKDAGSILIFDEVTSPEAKSIQVDNRTDSSGDLTVKVRRSDNSIMEITKLAPGQGIKDFNVSDRTFGIKDGSEDADQSTKTSGEILVPGTTVSFSEKLNRWITFYSYLPEMFGIINLEMISFLGGKLWIHNDNIIRNNFYGTQYTSQVETIFNAEPEKVKVFQSVGAESYHAWAVPSAKTPNGRETEMIAARFVRREDSFFAPVMNDKNDPLYVNQPIEAIINGRGMRDRTITVLFENGDTEEVVLYSLSMLGTISTRHKK